MANAPSFVEHALELLSSVGPVQARRMFGGHGVYCRGVMFGLLDDDELFVKTDELSRPTFVDAGCRMWVYPGAGMEETSYWRPPDGAHEDPEAMRPWAELGLAAALRKKAAKDAAARAKAERRKAKENAPAGKKNAAKKTAVKRKPAPKRAAPRKKPTSARKRKS
ncbi:MAG: TfoX/Sxy family protein [Anaeromyxobacteraceae bacterium]